MIELLKMSLQDIPTICQIEKKCFHIPWTKKMFMEELVNNMAHYIVVKSSGSPIGYGGMWYICDEAHITNVAIDPEFQQKGLGKKLIEHMIVEAKRSGIAKMTLEVRSSNGVALGLYKKYDFVECGVRKHYYEDNGEDAIIMWRDL